VRSVDRRVDWMVVRSAVRSADATAEKKVYYLVDNLAAG
jgi:hypothetical protein